MKSPFLDQLYQTVNFRVESRNKFTFSLKSPILFEDFCKKMGWKSASVIIAENPMATIHDWKDNSRYRTSLISLYQIRYPEQTYIQVTAIGQNKWPDESGLIFPELSVAQAKAFGLVYSQYAIVHWDKQGTRLVHCL